MYVFVCVCVYGAEYSSKQFSLCIAGLMSAQNFNDTSIKIGADVSQLAESQVEESEKSRVSKIECTLAAEKTLKLGINLQQCYTRNDYDLLLRYNMKENMSSNMKDKKTLQQTDS